MGRPPILKKPFQFAVCCVDGSFVTVMTQFENRKLWFARNIPLLAEEGWLRGHQEAAKRPFSAQTGAKRERGSAKL